MTMKVGVVSKCRSGSCLININVTCMCDFTTVESVTVGFEPTSYTISEGGPLVGEVCVQISNLMGELECNLVVTFNATSNSKSGTGVLKMPNSVKVLSCCVYSYGPQCLVKTSQLNLQMFLKQPF